MRLLGGDAASSPCWGQHAALRNFIIINIMVVVADGVGDSSIRGIISIIVIVVLVIITIIVISIIVIIVNWKQ